ncbi:hypothetical protein cce_2142 [Crocosphaera subtropica ATCC 51142]|uniref:Ribbon-helix-helix protein CopG domain-containing protein n=1 Tax=Crocosphaera subtropica (strain ATCC 51142 / BH68) TaxID=43989 RepID=B1WNR3_CROS5|nr:hypothetical protein [Crocosphaera subtropica]ACB51492.1 hypothetical protein cce_2142 [Crocosphaera subtropica ATCC 51142]
MTLTLNLTPEIEQCLRQKAAELGLSIEDYTLKLLADLVFKSEKSLNLSDSRLKACDLVTALDQRFSHIDNIELPEISRDAMRDIPTFTE